MSQVSSSAAASGIILIPSAPAVVLFTQSVYACQTCGKTFDIKWKRNRHVSDNHTRHGCECGKTFQSRGGLKRHRRTSCGLAPQQSADKCEFIPSPAKPENNLATIPISPIPSSANIIRPCAPVFGVSTTTTAAAATATATATAAAAAAAAAATDALETDSNVKMEPDTIDPETKIFVGSIQRSDGTPTKMFDPVDVTVQIRFKKRKVVYDDGTVNTCYVACLPALPPVV